MVRSSRSAGQFATQPPNIRSTKTARRGPHHDRDLQPLWSCRCTAGCTPHGGAVRRGLGSSVGRAMERAGPKPQPRNPLSHGSTHRQHGGDSSAAGGIVVWRLWVTAGCCHRSPWGATASVRARTHRRRWHPLPPHQALHQALAGIGVWWRVASSTLAEATRRVRGPLAVISSSQDRLVPTCVVAVPRKININSAPPGGRHLERTGQVQGACRQAGGRNSQTGRGCQDGQPRQPQGCIGPCRTLQDLP